MTEHHKLVFDGSIVEGYKLEDVKKNLVSLLKTDEKGVERLFSGKPTVIKKDVDGKTAVKFQKAFERAGAILSFETLESFAQPEVVTTEEDPISTDSNIVICPNCGYKQGESSECIKCGISFKQKEETVVMERSQISFGETEVVQIKGGAMILTNIESIPGKRIVEHFGLVSGSTIRAKHIGRDFMASLKNIVGGELKGYTELLNESRKQAVERMIEQTRQMGGNAIVNIRFSTSSVAQGAAELYAYGTAVRVE